MPKSSRNNESLPEEDSVYESEAFYNQKLSTDRSKVTIFSREEEKYSEEDFEQIQDQFKEYV